MESLSQQLEDLINPSPTLIDPEDGIEGESYAHLWSTRGTEPTASDDVIEDVGTASGLRRTTGALLADLNSRSAPV